MKNKKTIGQRRNPNTQVMEHVEPLIQKLTQAISSKTPDGYGISQKPNQTQTLNQSSSGQQFVQFYPNQTQYIINLHNYQGQEEQNQIKYYQNQEKLIQKQNRRRENHSIQPNRVGQQVSQIGIRKSSVNSYQTVDNTIGARGIRKNIQPAKIPSDIKKSSYLKLKTQFSIYKQGQNTQGHGAYNRVGGEESGNLTSRIKSQRQEYFGGNSARDNQSKSPTIKQRSREKRREMTTSLPKYNQNSHIPLNELLQKTALQSSQVQMGGPKLFIKRDRNGVPQAIQPQTQQFINPLNQSISQNTFETQKKLNKNNSVKSNHLDMYKSIPLKNSQNLRKSRGELKQAYQTISHNSYATGSSPNGKIRNQQIGAGQSLKNRYGRSKRHNEPKTNAINVSRQVKSIVQSEILAIGGQESQIPSWQGVWNVEPNQSMQRLQQHTKKPPRFQNSMKVGQLSQSLVPLNYAMEMSNMHMSNANQISQLVSSSISNNTQNRFKNGNNQSISPNQLDNNLKKQMISPICILDNANQNRNINQTEQQFSTKPISVIKNDFVHIKQHSQIMKNQNKSLNLSDQIRKVNKIQVKKRIKNNVLQFVKEARLLVESGDFINAKEKYLEYIKLQPLESQIHFEIGKLYLLIDNSFQNREEAIIHFEQVIKHNQTYKVNIENCIHFQKEDKTKLHLKTQLSAKALFEIILIQIYTCNFYQAHYELGRVSHFQFEKEADQDVVQKFKSYRQFVNAVILMMKRKIQEGISLLNEISIECSCKNKQINNEQIYLKYLVCVYLAYGYVAIRKYNSSIESFDKAQHLSKQHLSQTTDIKRLQSIAQFNQRLTKMLELEPKDKLKSIVQLRRNYPLNKEITRYHSIYLIMQRISFELNEYIQYHKISQKEQIIHELQERSPSIKKCRSETLVNKSFDTASIKSNNKTTTEQFNMFLQFQKVATCNIDDPLKQNTLTKSLQILQAGLSLVPKDKNLLLVRSYIYFYQHNFYEALCDIESVIEIERASSGEEEPSASDLLHKGRCHACLSMFKEAINDFNKVIELDEDLFDSYFFRGKCCYLIGDTSQAFLDFQKLIMLQPKNPMVHAFAGNLLMTTGSYDDATKAFTNADKVHPCAFAIYQRSRCYLALGDIKNSMNDLYEACSMYEHGKSQTMIHPNPLVERDKNCLETILHTLDFLNQNSDQISKMDDKKDSEDEMRLGSQMSLKDHSLSEQSEPIRVMNELSLIDSTEAFAILESKFDELVKSEELELREVQDRLNTNPSNLLSDKQIDEIQMLQKKITHDSRMHQQIIPNVNRIKLEKIRALLRQQAKQEYIDQCHRKKKKPDLSTFNCTNLQQDKELRNSGKGICPWSYYMESLFSMDDIYLYRAILRFYKGDYQGAISDLDQSKKIKKLNKMLDNQLDSDQSQEISFESNSDYSKSSIDISHSYEQGVLLECESEATDLSDIGLCSLNTSERIFCKILCFIKMNDSKLAFKYTKKLLKISPQKYHNDIGILKKLIKNWIKNITVLQEIPPVIEPFTTEHRLCKYFPYIEFKLPNGTYFMSRPSFSFPFVKPPNMIPNVDETLLFNEFGVLKDQSLAPCPATLWIKLQENIEQEEKELIKPEHYQFTDTIVQQSDAATSKSGISQSFNSSFDMVSPIKVTNESQYITQIKVSESQDINQLDINCSLDRNKGRHIDSIIDQQTKQLLEDEPKRQQSQLSLKIKKTNSHIFQQQINQ